MSDIIFGLLLGSLLAFLVLFLVISYFRRTFQVSYYQRLLERYEELGIELPENYQKVKNDIWLWIK